MSDAARADPMDDLAWSARPVIVFAASNDDPIAAEQLQLLYADRAALRDRDILVFEVSPDQVKSNAGLKLDADAMRARYGVREGSFAVLLVGKDTGVKRREDNLVPPRDLFMQIDGMPTRQREIQRN